MCRGPAAIPFEPADPGVLRRLVDLLMVAPDRIVALELAATRGVS